MEKKNVISKLEENLLDKESSLYKKVKSEKWWKSILEDKELYLDIRKKDIIDIYYLGGRAAQLKYDRNANSIKATAHPKYVGKNDPKDTTAYRERKEDGKVVYDAIYQDCGLWLMPDKITELKSNIKAAYVNAPDMVELEKISEKYIQAQLVLSGRDKYLDTEFQHRLYEGDSDSIRIDLVRIEENLIVFEELKRIVDPRLLSKDESKSEILTQIGDYRAFLEENKEELTKYYKTLYTIKKELGLPVPAVSDVDKLEVCTEPYLLIVKNYSRMTNGKDKRIKTLEKMLKEKKVRYEIREMNNIKIEVLSKQNFKESLKNRQIYLIENSDTFDHVNGGGILKRNGKAYAHLLSAEHEENNLYREIRQEVRKYFLENKISFWGGTTITPNTLSSQVACLNHLFLIRENEKAVKKVAQSFLGDRLMIESMEKVESEKEPCSRAYIAFEMVSDDEHNRMHERRVSRGNTCTSIDALAIAKGTDGKRYLLVIEWKLVEDDYGNKAPTKNSSSNKKAIHSGVERESNYHELIDNSKYINTIANGYFDTSLFNLPFYELMRQTLWAERNMQDFKAKDYFHIHVLPKDNPMRSKCYKCCENAKGVEKGWRSLLTKEGNERYIVVDPELVLKSLSDCKDEQINKLIAYLKTRYYNFKTK